jgi:membrane protein
MEKTISREGMEGKSLMKAEKKRRFAGLPGFTLRVIGKCSHDGIGAYAAQSAFFELMSVFPFLMLLLQLMRFAPVSQESLLFMVDNIFPDYLLPAMHEILQELYSSSFGLVSVSVITTLWAASKAMHAVTTGLDRICRAQEVRNWIVIRLWALLYTCLLAFIILLAVTSAVFWQALRDILVHYRPKGVPLHMYNMVLRSIYLIFLLTLVVAIMYKAFPHKRLSFIAQLPGAFFCAVSLYVFSNIITVYLNSFNGFSMYGSLTTLILVMFWLYFCNYFIMLGAEINEVRRQELLREEAEFNDGEEEEFNDGKEEEAEVL